MDGTRFSGDVHEAVAEYTLSGMLATAAPHSTKIKLRTLSGMSGGIDMTTKNPGTKTGRVIPDSPCLLGGEAMDALLPCARPSNMAHGFQEEPACNTEPLPSPIQRLQVLQQTLLDLHQTHIAEVAVLTQLLRAKSDGFEEAKARESTAEEMLLKAAKALEEVEARVEREGIARQRAEAEAGAAQERLAAMARESKAWEAKHNEAQEARERAEVEAIAARERQLAAAREGKAWEAREIKAQKAWECVNVPSQLLVASEQASLLEESLSAQARLSEALREAESSARSRDEFLAVMNHEIRTPLHAIMALLSLLKQSELTEDQQSMVHTVFKSTTLLCTLINNVLDFSRMEDDNLALDQHPFHLPSLFEQLEALAGSMAQAKGVRLVFRIDEGLPEYVLGDDQRMLQVLLNLVANSVKFTEPGGRVIVEASKVDSESTPECSTLKVTVADTGIGIRREDLHGKLFQKFVQADASITRKHGGTGLGLAICKKLVEMMQGRIWLESDGIGRGCTASFIVRLQHGTAPKPLRSPLLRSNALKGVQALVTDDNGINRLVTTRLLTTLGCEVAVAESGRSCLEQLALRRFELVLLDLSMPEMDGFQVFESIKRTYLPPVRPLVVALTANSDQRTRELCAEVGMDAIILKPVTISDLQEAICTLLESKSGVDGAPEYPS